MARRLRRWLIRTGADRRELHTTTKTTKAITWHDLQATGLTWMAVRGDEPLEIVQRAGHERYETIQRHVREVDALREGFGDVFPRLPETPYAETTNPPERCRAEGSGVVTFPLDQASAQLALNHTYYCGADGTRTRGLRRDRPAL